jgi:hypothetical protein
LQIFVTIVSVLCSLVQVIIKCLEYIDKRRKDKKSALIAESEQINNEN